MRFILTALLGLTIVFNSVQPASSNILDDIEAISVLDRKVGGLLRSGKYEKAMKLAKRSLKIAEKAFGPHHKITASSLFSLARIFKAQQDYDQAEPLYKRAKTIFEKSRGPDDPMTRSVQKGLVSIYYKQQRYVDIEAVYKHSLAINEKAFGRNHIKVASSLFDLANFYYGQGRYTQAEPLHKRRLAIYEKEFGPNHTSTAQCLNILAHLYRTQWRFGEAKSLLQRSIDIHEKTKRPEPLLLALALNNLASLYKDQGNYTKAEPLYKRTLAIYAKRGENSTGGTLNNLGLLYSLAGRFDEAERHLKRSLEIAEKNKAPDNMLVADRAHNLAANYTAQKRFSEAEPLFRRSLAIYQKKYGRDHANTANSLNVMADFYLAQNNWRQASHYWRQATDALIRRANREAKTGQNLSGQSRSEAVRKWRYFEGLIKSVYRDEVNSKHRNDRGAEMFTIAQWAKNSGAAASLARMAARGMAKDAKLGSIVRERQDLFREWTQLDKTRSSLLALSPNQRQKQKVTENEARLATVENRIDALNGEITKNFPKFNSFSRPQPLSVQETQNSLGANEAMVLFFDAASWYETPEETYIWVVTKEDMIWVRSPLGLGSLSSMVKRLRCGLDAAGWSGEKNKNAPCQDLTGRSFDLAAYYQGKANLPFEPDVAHQLYDGLFGQIKDKIKGKKLLLVPSGPLTSLPFQVLLSHKPAEGTTLQDMPWLIKDHALTVLPSVASLKALRRNAKASAAENPFLGFGNPLLLGRSGKDKSAWARQTCKFQPKPKPLRVAGLTIPDAISKYFRGGEVNVALLKRQSPLPETADELCAVAETIGASPSAVHLGARATEADVKRLSKQGALQQAKILHFATHGLLADETGQILKNKAEPSLLLTPPDKATEEDDGLLTASEITQLKLDADWVILSACNTAAGDKPGAEPMSGLAKAFFYAGARALLISHWAVQSDATVALITKSFAAQKQDPSLGRAGALRAAMLSLINSKNMAHPEYWAPFIVVGEGN